MSPAPQDPVIVERDGIRVEKRFFPAGEKFDDAPIIELYITSTLDEPVYLRLRDSIPDEFASDDPDDPNVGFHPEYEGNHWEPLDDSRIGFNRRLEPDETVQTLYAIVGPSDDEGYLFENEPSIYLDDPDDAPDGTEAVAPDAMADLGELSDGSVAERFAFELRSGDLSDDAYETILTHLGNFPVAPRLRRELDAAEETGVSDEDLIQLVETLDDVRMDQASGSTLAKVDRLAAISSDLEAYADALEEFIDEEGRGADLINRFESDLEQFKDDFEELEYLADQNLSERLDTLESDLHDVATLREELDEELDGLDEFQSTVESDVDTIRERTTAIEADVEDVTERTSDVEASADELSTRVGDLDDTVDALDDAMVEEERVGRLESTVDDLQTRVEAIDIDRLDSISEAVSDLQEQLSAQQETLSTLDEQVDALNNDETVAELTEQVEALDSTVSTQETAVTELEEALEQTAERDAVATLSDRIDTIESDLDEREDAAETVAELDATVSELETDVEEVLERFKRVQAAFGGLGGGGNADVSNQSSDGDDEGEIIDGDDF